MNIAPLSKEQIQHCAEKAAYIAYTILGLDVPYTVTLIDDPTISEDGLLGTQENEILINLATLKPFPTDIYGEQREKTPEDNVSAYICISYAAAAQRV